MPTQIKTNLPYHKDWDVYQGETWTRLFIYKDTNGNAIDLTGWTVKMDFRTRKGGDLIVSLSIGSGITNGGTNGTITWTLTAAQTNQLSGSPVYDLILTNAGATFVQPILTGNINVTQKVTQ